MKQNINDIALEAYEELRSNGFGRDTWMACEKGRLISRAHFGKKENLVGQVILIERCSKSGRAKKITGNIGTSVKGGKKRIKAIRIPELPPEIKKEIKEALPLNLGARASWLKTDGFHNLCRRLPKYHEGEIIRCVIDFAKKTHENKQGVYFNRDPLRPNEYNIGHTKRSPEKRLADAGSKARHWVTECFLEHVSEREIHKLMKQWQDKSGRGSETFMLNEEARKLLFEKHGIKIP